MQIKILPFGITKDILGGKSIHLEVNDSITIATLKLSLLQDYPTLKNLNSLAIALNGTYASDEQMIARGDEIVLIPPVSGG